MNLTRNAVAALHLPDYNSPALRLAESPRVCLMLEQSNRQDRLVVVRLLGFQVVLVVAAGLLGLMIDTPAALSLALGGSIGLLGNSWMALVMFRPRAASTPEGLLMSLYVGEAGKFLFVMAFFAIAFRKLAVLQLPANALLMLMAFGATQVLHWFWLLIEQKPDTSRKNITADE